MSVALELAPATLELKRVDLAFAGPTGERLQVLHGVDLKVVPGEIVCVAGRSGSGKSSLLYVAAGLLRAESGSVLWQGQDVSHLTDAALVDLRRACIGFVFQSGGLLDLLTARENVALPGYSRSARMSRSDAEARAESLLDAMGLASRSHHFPAQMSGGERQRVAVARALFRDPPLLIVDEPTASLDPAAATRMVERLEAVRSAGHAVLVASHDERVIGGSDRVFRLE